MKFLRLFLFAFILALLSVTASVSASPASAALSRMQALAASVKSPHVSSAQAQAHTAAWTVLVYMAADNDLESFGIADLNEMEFIGSTENLNIVVQMDRSPQYDDSNGDWQGARRFFVKQDTDLDNIASEQVGDLGVVNMGDPAALKDFIDWGVKTYPAQHYGLVIWDHGGSWLGVGIDDSADDDALQLPELDSALKDSLADSGISKFDIIGFDACLMGSIEVYRTIAPYASYGVASAELIPGQGWDYAGAFSAIADDPTIDAPTFGHAIVDSFNTFYTQIVTTYDYFSLGLVDLSATANVVSALDSFTGTATTTEQSTGAAIARARSKALVFGAFDDPQYADIWAATDMVGFMQQVQSFTKDTQVVDASDAVIKAGQQMIMYHLSSDTLANSQGVSIYFPRTATFFTGNNRNTRYGQDTPTDLNPWQKFLGTFYSIFSGSNPLAAITGATVDSNQQALFKLSFSGTGLSDALFYVALRLNDRPILVDYRRFPVGDFPETGAAEPTVTWAKKVPVVSDGTTQVPALMIHDRRNALRGVINGTFVPQNGDPQVPVQVLFDLSDPALGKSMSVWGIKDSLIGPMPSQIAVKPGDKFIPAWLSIGANGQLNGRSSGTTLTFTSSPLLYFFIDAPQAVYDIGVQAESASGVVAATTTTAQVDTNGVLTVNPPEPKKNDEPTQNPPEQPTQPPSTPPPGPPAPPSNNDNKSSSTGSPAAIDPVGGSTSTNQVGEPFAQPFEVTVKDSSGHPVSGVTVTFTAPSSGPSGTFAQGSAFAPNTLDQVMVLLSGASAAHAQENGTNSATTQTGSNGTATSPQFTANTVAGSYVVTATTSNGLTLEFHVTNEPGPPVNIEAISGTPQTAEVLTPYAIALQALVTDQYGNSVPNVGVNFFSPNPDEGAGGEFDTGDGGGDQGGDDGGTAMLGNTIMALLTGANVTSAAPSMVSATTNSVGIATAPTLTANFYVGDFTVSATIGTQEGEAHFLLTNVPGAPDSIDFIVGDGTQSFATVTEAFANGFEVRVFDTHGNPVDGGSVTFTLPGSTFPGGTFDNADQETPTTLTVDIDADGYAQTGPIHANTHAGQYSLIATSGVAQEFRTLTNEAGDPANISLSGGSPQSAQVGQTYPESLQVLVTDQYSNPVPGVSVTFDGLDAEEGPSGRFNDEVNTATDVEQTDADGIATSLTITANHVVGSFDPKPTATAEGVTGTVEFDLTNLVGDPYSLVADYYASEQSAQVGTCYELPLNVTLTDFYGNAIPDATITWTAPLDGASGSFVSADQCDVESSPTNLDATAVTDSDGEASPVDDDTPLSFKADHQPGGVEVVASYDDDEKDIHLTAPFDLTNLTGPAKYVTIVDGANEQQAVVTEYYDNPLEVKVTDRYLNPVSGVTIELTSPSSGEGGPTGYFDISEGSRYVQGETGEDGIYTPPDFYANRYAGSFEVAIDTPDDPELIDEEDPPIFELTNLADAPDSIEAYTDTSTAVVGNAFTTLEAHVYDQYGNPVEGAPVTFSAPAFTDPATPPPTVASGTFAATDDTTDTVDTDEDGVASASVFTANHKAGNNYSVTMTSGSLFTAITLSNLHDVASKVVAVSGGDQQKEIGGDYGLLVAKVTDQYNNPVSGVSVTFQVDASTGGGGTFQSNGLDNETPSSPSGSDGKVTSSKFTANGTAGSFVVKAQAASTMATFALVNLYPHPHINELNDEGAPGLIPSYTTLGNPEPPESITINGEGFVPDISEPRWDGEACDGASAPCSTDTITANQIILNLLAGSLDSAGRHDITVFNPFTSYVAGNPAGSESEVRTFTIYNPTPYITNLNPDTINAGESNSTAHVYGSGFVEGAIVHWAWTDDTGTLDVALDTQYINDSNGGELTYEYDSEATADGRVVDVYVENPDPVLDSSNRVPLTINNPFPVIDSVTPDHGIIGTGTPITVVSDDDTFVPSSQIKVAEDSYGESIIATLDTHFDNSGQLTATIPGDIVSESQPLYILVTNPAPGGGTSEIYSSNFYVYDPVPTITSLEPTEADLYNTFELTINGSNFIKNDSQVIFNGHTYSNIDYTGVPTQLKVTIDGEDNTTSGNVDVQVDNINGYVSGTPQHALSNTEQINILEPNPTPELDSLEPASICAGASTFTLIVHGSNFVNGATVLWRSGEDDPTELPTTFDNSGQLSATVDSSLVASSQTFFVDVRNPAPPDGGVQSSSSQHFHVNGSSTDLHVDENGDSGPGSLRDAVAQACDGSTIYVHDFVNLESAVTIDKDITIVGQGEGNINITGPEGDSIFEISSGATVSIAAFDLTDAGDSAIVNDGTLDLSYAYFTDNTASNGAGIRNSGTLTANYVEFETGENGSADKGGGIYNSGTATVRNSAFNGTTANQGGGVYNADGGTFKGINLTFWDSTATSGSAVYSEDTTKLSFITVADSHNSPAFAGSGFAIKNGLFFSQDGICDGSFSGTFSGVNLGAGDGGCGSDNIQDVGSSNVFDGSSQNNGVFFFHLDVAGPAVAATDCTDVDGDNVTTSVNGNDRPTPSDATSCDVGPAEEDETPA